MRLLPHAPNLAPIAAISLFAGAYLNKKIVPWVPLAIMILSDVILGLHNMIFFTWGAFILVGFLGIWLKENKSAKNICLSGILSAVLFFLISNFGVWLAWYPHNLAGFTDCFIKAIPFFRNTMVSNLAFTVVLFGTYELAIRLVGEKRYKKVLIAK